MTWSRLESRIDLVQCNGALVTGWLSQPRTDPGNPELIVG